MYIFAGDRKQIINSEFVERFCIAVKPDAALVIASYSETRPPVTISRYRDSAEANDALQELLSALARGERAFSMPDSIYYFEEKTIKDARTKRRGGS